VDLFEEIRREYEFGLASISGVARKFGVHRRMVREAIESSIPMRLPAKERPRPTIGPLAGFIDEILEDDRRAPRKQRHTAHRIWVRLGTERSGYQIAESTVRQYVRQRKRTLGLRVAPEAFVPQQYDWGDEAQVDYVSVRQAGSGRVGWNGSIGMLLVLKLDLVDEVHFDLKWCLRWPVYVVQRRQSHFAAMLCLVIWGHCAEHAVQHGGELASQVANCRSWTYVALDHALVVLAEGRVAHARCQQYQRHLAKCPSSDTHSAASEFALVGRAARLGNFRRPTKIPLERAVVIEAPHISNGGNERRRPDRALDRQAFDDRRVWVSRQQLPDLVEQFAASRFQAVQLTDNPALPPLVM